MACTSIQTRLNRQLVPISLRNLTAQQIELELQSNNGLRLNILEFYQKLQRNYATITSDSSSCVSIQTLWNPRVTMTKREQVCYYQFLISGKSNTGFSLVLAIAKS